MTKKEIGKDSKEAIEEKDIEIYMYHEKPQEEEGENAVSQTGIRLGGNQNLEEQEAKKPQKRKSQLNKFYPSDSYIYPYYYDSSGCFYCCLCNGHCCPCRECHRHGVGAVCCDPYPCCNGCHGFHCGCFDGFLCCGNFECVKNNNCEDCNLCLFTFGCHYCYEECDGSCISTMPCCNDSSCYECCSDCDCTINECSPKTIWQIFEICENIICRVIFALICDC